MFDAAGSKLKKTTVEGPKTTGTLYISNFVYQNDMLQYVSSYPQSGAIAVGNTASYIVTDIEAIFSERCAAEELFKFKEKLDEKGRMSS